MASSGGRLDPAVSTVHPVLAHLKATLKCSQSHLNFFSLNAQSLTYDKLVELRTFLDPNLFHVLAFCETWWKPSQFSNSFSIDGFRLFRSDRIRSREQSQGQNRSGLVRGGGLALYIKNNINARLVLKSKADAIVEYIFVSIRLGGTSILIGSVYNPNRNNVPEITNLLYLLAETSLDFDHVIVLGDLNFDLLQPQNSFTSQYLELIKVQLAKWEMSFGSGKCLFRSS
jgi:hypothetical protein